MLSRWHFQKFFKCNNVPTYTVTIIQDSLLINFQRATVVSNIISLIFHAKTRKRPNENFITVQ